MTYEYRCRQCSTLFEVHATLEEKNQGLRPACPDCGSSDVGRVFSAFYFVRGGASATSAASGASNGVPAASSGCACGGACSCRH